MGAGTKQLIKNPQTQWKKTQQPQNLHPPLSLNNKLSSPDG